LNMHSWKIIARGRVQGVGFRHYAQTCARRCGITGYVRNLYDGSVLIEATGDQESLNRFCELLRNANRFIDVRELEITEQEETVMYNDFQIW